MRTIRLAGLLVALGGSMALAQTDPFGGGHTDDKGGLTGGGGGGAAGLDALDMAQFTQFESLGNGSSDLFDGGLFANGTEMVLPSLLGVQPRAVEDNAHIDLNRLLVDPARNWGRPQAFLLELIARHPIAGINPSPEHSGDGSTPAAEPSSDSPADPVVTDGPQQNPQISFDPHRWQRRRGPQDPIWRRRGGDPPPGDPKRVVLVIPDPPGDPWLPGGKAHARPQVSNLGDLVAQAAAEVVRRRIAREVDPNGRSSRVRSEEQRADRARVGLVLLDVLDGSPPSDPDRDFLRAHRAEALEILASVSQAWEDNADPISAEVATNVRAIIDWLRRGLGS